MTSLKLTPREQRIWDDTVVAIVSRDPLSSALHLRKHPAQAGSGIRWRGPPGRLDLAREDIYESATFLADELIAYLRRRT